ncbi:hypothetical protein AB5I41_09580 [Sphingomonas sp. MMS24-JH45]
MSHTPRESAIYLLDIFRENDCEPEEYLYAAIFAYPFTQEDWTTLDFTPASPSRSNRAGRSAA